MTRFLLMAALLLLAFGCRNPDTTPAPGADTAKGASGDDSASVTYACRCGVTKEQDAGSPAPS